MSLHFHALTVKEVCKETDDCVSILLDIPENLQQTFSYKQGQNITIKKVINNQEVRRSYSLCSSPLSKEFRIAVKQIAGGIFSTYANLHLKKGDVLEVMPPVGKFYTDLNIQNKKKYVAFAVGSGITPIISIIKTTLASEPNSTFTLVFGNKNHNSIIFKEELEALKNKYLQRFHLIHILSKEKNDTEINYGRIDANKLKELSAFINFSQVSDFFICGPEQMIFTIKNFLENENVDSKKIHFELFISASQNNTTTEKKETTVTSTTNSKVQINVDGRSFEFALAQNTKSILDAALQHGADLPFACKGGVCCTCKAKLVEGKVTMKVHWGLEDDEIAKGYILTCQSHPITDKVVVDYDDR